MAPTPRPRASPAVDRRRGSPSSEAVPVQSELAQLFQHDINDLRALIICGICVKPLYEPFTVACGHTFCYSCLTQWFKNHRRRKTCPDCRAAVRAEPAPAYLLRNMVHTFISRPELLEDGETTAEHLAIQRAESEKIERDKANTDPQTGGLFEGCFKHNALSRFPINDLEDGVERCPECAWELEDGECATCGFTLDMISSSGFDSDELGDGMDSQFDTDMGEAMEFPPGYPVNYTATFQNGHSWTQSFNSHFFTVNGYTPFAQPFAQAGDDVDDSEDDSEDSDDDEYDSEMQDFIVGDGPDDGASDGTDQDTVVGDHTYLTISSGTTQSSSPYGVHPAAFDSDASSQDTTDSEQERTFDFAGGTGQVVQVVSSDDSDSDSDSDSDDPDEPVRAPGRGVRAPQRTAPQSNHRNPSSRSRASRFHTNSSTRPEVVNVDDDSDEPRRLTRARATGPGRHYQRRRNRRRGRGGARPAVRVN